MGTATKADRDALACYCEAVVTHRKASKVLAKSDILILGAIKGTAVRNPAVQIQRDSAALVRAFAQEFGFTPSARSEIRTGAASRRGADTDRYLTG
jgi:P27 family predicted phage terminase small subunit